MSPFRLALLATLAVALAGPAAAAPPPLTAEGWGKLRIGMRERDAVRLFRLRVPPTAGVDSFECRQDQVPGYPGVFVMAENGVITRISVDGPGRLRTDRGFGVGSREADIRRAYGTALEVATAAYLEEPAHDLTFWTHGGRRGVKYGTNADGRVDWLTVGSRSITYIEGCA